MANEVTYKVSLAASKGGASIDSGTISDTVTMSGSDVGTETGAATNTAALIATPASITWASGARVMVQNLGSADITIGVNNASPPTQVQSIIASGEVCLLQGLVAQPYIYAPSTTAYQVWAVEK